MDASPYFALALFVILHLHKRTDIRMHILRRNTKFMCTDSHTLTHTRLHTHTLTLTHSYINAHNAAGDVHVAVRSAADRNESLAHGGTEYRLLVLLGSGGTLRQTQIYMFCGSRIATSKRKV